MLPALVRVKRTWSNTRTVHRLFELSLFATCLLSLACSSPMLAADSAEPTSCPEDQLEISEVNQPMEGPSSWVATCQAEGRQQRWFCSRAATTLSVICTEDPRAPATTAAD